MKTTTTTNRKNRIAALVGAAMIFVMTALFAFASCVPGDLEETTGRGQKCSTDGDCLYFLSCASGVCRQRCGANRNCSSGPDCAYCTCNGAVCLPGTSGTDTSPTGTYTNPTATGTGSNGCAPAGTLVRSDLPAASSTAAFAVDSTHVYVSAAASDSLGNVKPAIFAGTLDGKGSFQKIWTPASTATSSGFGPPPIYRSGASLYFTDDGALKRVPAPPVGTTAAEPEVVAPFARVLATTSSQLFANDMTNGLVRIDGVSGTADPTALGAATNYVATTPTKAFWFSGASGGDGGPMDPGGEVLVADIASGPGASTGVFPDMSFRSQAFGAAGNGLFFTSPNGTLVRFDTAVPGASATVVRMTSGTNPVLYLAGEALWTQIASSNAYCVELARFNLTTLADQPTTALGPGGTYGYTLAADDDWVYWLTQPYYGSSSQPELGVLRRVSKKK